MDKLVSIIVPVYNVQEYLCKCVDSILSQSYSNLEIILVDDGSKDNSAVICDEYAARDNRIKVIHKVNGGVSSARNAGLDIAKGEYIGFVDSDDYVSTDMFEKLVKACEEYQTDISMCNHYVEENGELKFENSTVDKLTVYSNLEALKLLIGDDYIKNYCFDKLYRASLFEGIRFPLVKAYEDLTIMYLLFEKANAICHIPDIMYYYLRHTGSLSGHVTDSQWHENCGLSLEAQAKRYEYFAKNYELSTQCLENMIKYVYSYMHTGAILGDIAGNEKWRSFLISHKDNIKSNPYISDKDIKLLGIYTMPDGFIRCYVGIKNLIRHVSN